MVGELSEGVLVLRVLKGDKVLSETVYDGRVVGGKVAAEGGILDLHPVATRNGAVLAINTSGATSFLGVNASGQITRLAIEP